MSNVQRIAFEVPGTPGAQGRPKVSSFAGHARAYKAKADVLYEGHVRDSFYRSVEGQDWQPLTGPVAVSLAAIFEAPKGLRKAQRAEIEAMWAKADRETSPCSPRWLCQEAYGPFLVSGLGFAGMLRAKRPDLDNIVKAILDGLNGHAFKDDAQVVKLEAVKIYGSPPRTMVQVVGLG